ncbi:MAG: methyltransferase [Betaproteobacteria bacterium]|nr:methyltransferase [Betaproteobacteria bacterium]
MKTLGNLRSFFAVALLLSAGAYAQPAQKPFEPFSGQPGKDVVWVPTSQALVDKMLDMAKLAPNEVHMDLGSGDGRTVITAAKRGARSTGIEYNPDMVELSKQNAAKAGVGDKATFIKADLFETDFSQASVITLFLLPDINLKLRPKILNLKPGTRIVSNTFTMGEWKDDETATVDEGAGCSYYCTAHLWIVPAKVAGTWHSAQGDLTLKQEFQMVQGSLKSGTDNHIVSGAKLRADQLTFSAGGANYSGRVSGNTIDGTVINGGNSAKWTATRR